MNTDKTKYRKIGLLPYQADFAAITSRFKIGLWARQTGKDHTVAAEAVVDCMQNPRTTWIIVAASERQALESLAKAKEWAAFLKFAIHEYNEAPAHLPGSVARPSNTRSTEIKWSNGSRLIALPANPSTIRGYSANLILTEFAFHENPDAIWRAIYPTISNPLRGGPKKLRIISTPNGLNNKFAHLWHSNHFPRGTSPASPILSPNLNPNLNPNLTPNPSGGPARAASGFPVPTLGVPPLDGRSSSPITNQKCSMLDAQWNLSPSALSASSALIPSSSPTYHSSLTTNHLFHTSRVTIHDAIRAGLPLDPAELQAGLNDPEAWSQEYLCEFMDNSSVLLPYDLIESCESSLATELSTPQSLSASAIPNNGTPQLFAGLDFARKNHLTVCWILEKLPSPLGGTSSASPTSSMPNEKCSIPNAQWTYLTREVLCLQNRSTPEQIELLRPRLNLCRKVCLDYTGPGIGLGDFLHRELGSHKLELCPFTSSFKAELFPRLVAAFESRELLIPIGRDIREDLHSIYRTTTNSGTILYRAHATPDGHADRTTALALAVRAAQTAPPPACATVVGRRNPVLVESNRRRLAFYNPTRFSR